MELNFLYSKFRKITVLDDGSFEKWFNDKYGLQIETDTPRNVLKESNDNGNARRKSYTPRLFNLFPLRGHATVTAATSQPQDEVSLKLRIIASTMFLIFIAFLLSYYQ